MILTPPQSKGSSRAPDRPYTLCFDIAAQADGVKYYCGSVIVYVGQN